MNVKESDEIRLKNNLYKSKVLVVSKHLKVKVGRGEIEEVNV